MKISLFIGLVLIFMVRPAFALFCPASFEQIELGYTINHVIQLCGKPYHQVSSKSDLNAPQQWNLYVTPVGEYGGPAMPANTQSQASLKMEVAFNENKVINITVNGMSLASTTICGSPVSVGDSSQSVQAACGKPAIVSKGQSSADTTSAPEVTELTYNTNPPIILVFTNGLLTERKQSE